MELMIDFSINKFYHLPKNKDVFVYNDDKNQELIPVPLRTYHDQNKPTAKYQLAKEIMKSIKRNSTTFFSQK